MSGTHYSSVGKIHSEREADSVSTFQWHSPRRRLTHPNPQGPSLWLTTSAGAELPGPVRPIVLARAALIRAGFTLALTPRHAAARAASLLLSRDVASAASPFLSRDATSVTCLTL